MVDNIPDSEWSMNQFIEEWNDSVPEECFLSEEEELSEEGY